MNDSSLPYWERRWAGDHGYSASWPDDYARALELDYLRRELPPTGSVLELGCGAFGLAEDPRVAQLVRGRYLGIDGSREAIDQARLRSERLGGGWDFERKDLTAAGTIIPLDADFVLTKRFLQNLVPEARRQLFTALGQFKHGLLIEDLVSARKLTDEARASVGRGPLAVPEFNWPIADEELDALGRMVVITPFMGWFYAMTRVMPDLPKSGHQAAYQLSHDAIMLDREQPMRGPVVAISW